MTKNIAIALVLLAAAAGGYLVYNQNAADTPEPQAASTPANGFDITLPDLDGVERHLSEWQGQARIVNFWATWCAPCRREIPLLKKTQEQQAVNGVQIIGIAVDFPEDVAAYAEEAQFNYPILVGQEEAMAAAEESGVEFIGMPFTLVVSRGGEILKAHMGEIVESHIETILDVFQKLENSELDADGARDALSHL